MRSIKKITISLLFLIGLSSTILVTHFNTIYAKGNQLVKETERTDYVFDTSEITINDADYTVLLRAEGMQLISDQGEVYQTLQYPEGITEIIESDQISDALSESGILNKEIFNLSIITIGDIDEKGTSDFMLTIKSNRVKEFNQLVAISYETSSVIWEYAPTIKTSKLCDVRTFCNEPTNIVQVGVIDELLYLVSGYDLTEIDIRTGEKLKQYHHSNNVWYYEFISDVNDDGVNDLVIAVQPSKILLIDGKTFKKISEHDVAKDLKLTEIKTLKLSVRQLEYLPNKNRLLAASEDGNVYELSLPQLEIVTKTQLFPTNDLLEYFSTLRYSNESFDLEFYDEGKITYYLSGFEAPVSFHLEGFASIDEDLLEDYVIEWKWRKGETPGAKNQEYPNFVIERTELGPLVFDEADYHFKKDDFIIYTGFGYLNIWDLKENKKVLVTNHNIHPGTVVNKHSDGFFLLDPKPKVSHYILENKSTLTPNFVIDSPYIKASEMTDYGDYFINVEQRLISGEVTDSVTVYNQNFESIMNYSTEKGMSIIHKELVEDTLYLVEAQGEEQRLTTNYFNLTTGELVGSYEFDYRAYTELTSGAKDDVYFDSRSYYDVNQDGVSELLLVANYQYNTQVRRSRYIIYDFLNTEILTDNPGDHYVVSDFIIQNDVNEDGYPELLTHDIKSYFYYDRTVLSYNLTKTSGDDLFKDPSTVSRQVDLPYGNYELVKTVDLNNDGYVEFLLNFTDSVYTHETAFYIFDYKHEYVIKVGDFTNNDYRVEDLDGDGIKEFITVEAKSLVQSELVIHNYEAGKVNSPYTYKIDHFYSDAPLEHYALYDKNQDGVKDLLFATYDERQNISIEAIDYKTNQVIDKTSYNIFEHESDVDYGSDLTYTNIELNMFNHEPYLIVNGPTKDYDTSDFSYTIKKPVEFVNRNYFLFEPDSFRVAYIVGEHENQHEANMYKMNDGSLFVKNPIKYDDINTKLSGVNQTNYSFEVLNNRNVDHVLAIISDETLKSTSILEFNEGHVDFNLSDGEYFITFYIYTDEGHLFLYHDQIVIEREDSESMKYQGIVLAALSIAFIGSSIIIRKYIHK